MKKISNVIISSILVGSFSFLQAQDLKDIFKDKNIFIAVSTNYSIANMKKENNVGSVILNNKIDESSNGLGIELGYKYNEDIELSINYDRINNSDLGFDNLYLTSKYLFSKQSLFNPYVAFSVGVSQLSWDRAPVPTVNNDTESSSYLIGGKLGLLYSISKNVKIDINYSLSFMDHETKVESFPNKSTLKHEYVQSLKMGLRYDF